MTLRNSEPIYGSRINRIARYIRMNQFRAEIQSFLSLSIGGIKLKKPYRRLFHQLLRQSVPFNESKRALCRPFSRVPALLLRHKIYPMKGWKRWGFSFFVSHSGGQHESVFRITYSIKGENESRIFRESGIFHYYYFFLPRG